MSNTNTKNFLTAFSKRPKKNGCKLCNHGPSNQAIIDLLDAKLENAPGCHISWAQFHSEFMVPELGCPINAPSVISTHISRHLNRDATTGAHLE